MLQGIEVPDASNISESLQPLSWKAGSEGVPHMRLIHAAFAVFEHLMLYGTPTVRSLISDICGRGARPS